MITGKNACIIAASIIKCNLDLPLMMMSFVLIVLEYKGILYLQEGMFELAFGLLLLV